jgi:hypothetical protein
VHHADKFDSCQQPRCHGDFYISNQPLGSTFKQILVLMAEFVTIVGTLSEPCPAAVGKETSTRAVDTAITFQGSSMTPLFGLPTPSGASVTIYGRDSLGTVRGLQDSLGTALFSSSLARLHVHGAKRNDILLIGSALRVWAAAALNSLLNRNWNMSVIRGCTYHW